MEISSIYGEIKKLITEKLKSRRLISLKTVADTIIYLIKAYRRNIKMAKVDLKLGTSLVTVYDGKPEGLNSFLDSVALLKEHVTGENASAPTDIKTAAEVKLAKFIKTRLTGIARQVIPEVEL